jgi:glycerol uptake facilitator-like aquaporin
MLRIVKSPTLPEQEIVREIRTAAVEFGLTATFMVTVFTIVRWVIGSMPAVASGAEIRLRVAVASILVGFVIVGFVGSAPGRFSGAHMNPAITLGLYAFGSVPARRVLPYLVAQTGGSIAAAAVARIVWGPRFSEGPTRWAVVQPAAGWTSVAVAIAEAVTLMVIVGVMCSMAGRLPKPRLTWIVGGLFALQGAVLGPLAGGSANPARQLGPALLSGESQLLGVYLLAPVAGGMLAGCLARHVRTAARPVDADGETHANEVSRSMSEPGRTGSDENPPPLVDRYAAPLVAVPARTGRFRRGYGVPRAPVRRRSPHEHSTR